MSQEVTLVGRAGRWTVAALVTVAAFAVATLVSGIFLTRLLSSSDIRWPVAFSIGAAAAAFAGLWGQWKATESGNADRAAGLSLAEIADGLASRLRSQWADEAEARGLNDPYPLPVTWTAADGLLAGDLDALKKLATIGAGWSRQERKHWAKRPEDLAGGGRKLADVLALVPTGRLVVLGKPGAGKTMLMVGLVLDLLHPGRRSSGGPVPVLGSLASWDPFRQDLHSWLGATLVTGYPDLAAAVPGGTAGDNRFDALVEAGLVLPILDGLDEIPESARPVAITRINKELKPGEQVVVTCRTEQYQAAVSPQHSQGAALRAAAVQLSNLEFGEVASYLRKDAGPADEDRWDFLYTLSPASPVRQALATPLMAGLARTIYNPRPGELASSLRDPVELCAQADQTAVEAHLFDAFIPAAYRPPSRVRWTARQAERWLTFLARHLNQTIGSPDLAWWQLQKAVKPTLFRNAAGLLAGLVAGLLAGLVRGLASGAGAGFGAGFGAAFGCWLVAWLLVGLINRAQAPASNLRIRGRALAFGLAGGLLAGSGAGLRAGAGVGVGVGVLSWLVGGVERAGDLAGITSPRKVLARDRRVALIAEVVVAVAGAVAGGVKLGLGVACGLAGALAGLGLSMNRTAWPSYMLSRGWVACHRDLPWSLMNFLADAHQRGVLRQAGAVYQFRHIELQRRLATGREQDSALHRPSSVP